MEYLELVYKPTNEVANRMDVSDLSRNQIIKLKSNLMNGLSETEYRVKMISSLLKMVVGPFKVTKQ